MRVSTRRLRRRARGLRPVVSLPSDDSRQDPNERKAGLWIWGLFEEPLYPYLLLTLEANRVEVAEGGYHVPAGRLLGEMRHARGSKQGSVLTDGLLRFEVTKTYQADLVGLSKVAVGEPTTCGRLRADCLETR